MESNLVFAGLVGMIDPPREEVKDAVRICREAGIKPVMITDSDFKDKVYSYSVYARVSPEHKVRIIKAWKTNGKTVAMTGDGVNDAPALKASDMILSDDNFATIVEAIKEGRKIYSNIRKSIQFLLSANMGEVITLFIATILGWTILFPIHILWINLVTDALPAFALGVERAEMDIMKQKPRKSGSSIFSESLGINVIYQGIIEGLITLGVFYVGLKLFSQNSHDIAITMAFVTLGLIQLTHSLNYSGSPI